MTRHEILPDVITTLLDPARDDRQLVRLGLDRFRKSRPGKTPPGSPSVAIPRLDPCEGVSDGDAAAIAEALLGHLDRLAGRRWWWVRPIQMGA